MRSLAQSRAKLVGGISWQSGARRLGTSPQQTEAAASSSTLKKFLLALVPIGVIAAVVEHAHAPSEAPAAAVTAVHGSAASAAAPSASGQPKVSIQGGVTSHGMEIDPANPLHKMLPETDCEFCLETREKLWGMVKAIKADGKGKAAAQAGQQRVPEAAQAAAASPAE